MGTKKYTMEEFKEMYEKAQAEAIKELKEEMEIAVLKNEKEVDPMAEFAFTMQNMMATAKVYQKLFKEEN